MRHIICDTSCANHDSRYLIIFHCLGSCARVISFTMCVLVLPYSFSLSVYIEVCATDLITDQASSIVDLSELLERSTDCVTYVIT